MEQHESMGKGILIPMDVTDVHQWRGGREGQGGTAPSDNFLGALKSKGGAKIRNCQCEISYKICKVQLVNKFKVVAIQ